MWFIAFVVVVVVVAVVVADYVCEAYNNPPDFFLDVLNGNVAVSAAVTSGDTKRPNGESFACLLIICHSQSCNVVALVMVGFDWVDWMLLLETDTVCQNSSMILSE